MTLASFERWLSVLSEALAAHARYPVPSDANEAQYEYQFGRQALIYRWRRGDKDFFYKLDESDCHRIEEMGRYGVRLVPKLPIKAPALTRFHLVVDGIFAAVLDLEFRTLDHLSTDVELARMLTAEFNAEFPWSSPPPAPDEFLVEHRRATERYSAGYIKAAYDRALDRALEPDVVVKVDGLICRR